jgi:hypothetical protein
VSTLNFLWLKFIALSADILDYDLDKQTNEGRSLGLLEILYLSLFGCIFCVFLPVYGAIFAIFILGPLRILKIAAAALNSIRIPVPKIPHTS